MGVSPRDSRNAAISGHRQKSLKLWTQLSRNKTWLEPASFHSSSVYQNGMRGQCDRSCQVLKGIIRCLRSEAHKRDELKIQQLQEHLGSRRISWVPGTAAEQRPPLKRVLPVPVASASR